MKIKNKLLLAFTAVFSLGASAVAEDYYICTGSFRIKENALSLQKELKEAGIDTFIYEYQKSDDLTLYRVLIDEGSPSSIEIHGILDKYEDSQAIRKMNITGLWCCKAEKTDGGDNEPIVLEVKNTDMVPLIDVAATKEVDEDALEEATENENAFAEEADFNDGIEIRDTEDKTYSVSNDIEEKETSTYDEASTVETEETITDTEEDPSTVHDEYTLDKNIYSTNEEKGLKADELEILDDDDDVKDTEEEFSLTYPEEGWSN